jgi:DNA repair protein RadC
MTEIQSSRAAYQILCDDFNADVEEVWVLALNTQLVLVGKEMIFRGTVDSCPFYPRDIFRFLIQKNATAFILAHNHPSNNLKPSQEDITATRRIQKLGEMLEICLLDHLVLGKENYFSLADAGLVKSKLTAKSRRPY